MNILGENLEKKLKKNHARIKSNNNTYFGSISSPMMILTIKSSSI